MKKKMLLVAFLAACLTVLAGCSCEHVWVEADCVNAKTCSECQETEGTAFFTDMCLSTAVLNAAARAEYFGYHTQNQLLYEGAYLDETVLGEGSVLLLTNVYASDFR